MNKTRNAAIKKIAGEISDLKTQLESLRDEEQAYFDELSEKAQEGDTGTEAEVVVSNLEDAIGQLESAEESVNSATTE